MKEPEVFISSSAGIYIPQECCKEIQDKYISDALVGDFEVCRAGPDEEGYWDAWTSILDNFEATVSGVTYYLYQDGDLWWVPKGWCVADDGSFYKETQGDFNEEN